MVPDVTHNERRLFMPTITDPRLFGLGDVAVDDAFYDQHVVQHDTLQLLAAPGWETLPPAFDARERRWVTPAKNQGSCGSCWAHAAVGTMESRLLKEGYPAFDLSEQQLISCNTDMDGCCGGSGQSLMFYKTNRPWREQDAPYAEMGTACPVQRTRESADFSGITGIGYLATSFYTIDRTNEAMKQSLVTHGPFYFRYDVYDDFYGYWSDGSEADSYLQKTGSRQGGHAVLLIGWSDTRKSWLIKNSWGPSTGPNKDGTFWIRYDGHANDLKFQGFNLGGISTVKQ
jgi:C1A family cysteine protease